MRRVIVTGVGIISSIGSSTARVTQSLREGRSGIDRLPEREALGFRSLLSGTIKDYTPPDLSKRYKRQMGDGAQMAYAAVCQALENAGLAVEQIQNERAGVIVGNPGNFHEIYQQCDTIFIQKKKLSGMALPRTMGSSVSANLSVVLGTRGYNMTIASACASGATAIGQAAHAVRYGFQDVVIAGGMQEDSWEFAHTLDALRVVSVRNDEPAKASRPFDRDRDGLVPSGGAGFVILESLEHARQRGATSYAEVIGFGANSDGFDITTPSSDGAVGCMHAALDDAGIDAAAVDYINAHATSTPVGDVNEAQAIAKVFGEHPFVSSTKSMTGHGIGTAGSNELIYTLLMMKGGFIAANTNIDEIDEQCRCINLVANEAIDVEIDVAISNSFGFGGVNTCLVVRRLPELD